MQEKLIRESTASLIDAYIELNGMYDGISLDDFIKLRKLAVDELYRADTFGFINKTTEYSKNLQNSEKTGKTPEIQMIDRKDDVDKAKISKKKASTKTDNDIPDSSKKETVTSASVLPMPTAPQFSSSSNSTVRITQSEPEPEPVEEEAPARQLSRFELLKSMPDEWN